MVNGYTLKFNELKASDFIVLSKSVGWGVNRVYDMEKVEEAIRASSFTVLATSKTGEVLGCARAFSDDLLMTFIPDIFVDPKWQKNGIGKAMVEAIKENYGHTKFFFGAQPGNEGFFENLGFHKSIQSYAGNFRKNPHYS